MQIQPNPRKTLFQHDLNEVSNKDVEGVGTLREDVQGNVYRYVSNLTPSAMNFGDWCAYPATDFSASSALVFTRVQLNMGPDFSANTLAGVIVASGGLQASASSAYGWIQIEGFFSGASYLQGSGTTLRIGDKVHPYSASASASLLQDSSTAATKAHYGISLAALASTAVSTISAAISVRIHCL